MNLRWIARLLRKEGTITSVEVGLVADQVRRVPPLPRLVIVCVGCVASFLPRTVVTRLESWPFVGAALRLIFSTRALVHQAEAPQSRHVAGDPVTATLSSLRSTGSVFDLIVIGSGPGGAIAAARAAGSGLGVLVLEDGSAVPSGHFDHPSREQTFHQLRAGGQGAILAIPPVLYAEARTLGGGSEVNSGFYHRLPEELRPIWHRALKTNEPEWTTIEREVEERLSISFPPTSDAAHPLLLGARALGLEHEPLPVWSRFTGDTSEHQGMLRTYLADAVRDGAEVRADTRVERLRLEQGAVRILTRDGTELQAAEVVLAAGTFETPFLLSRSALMRISDARLSFHPMLRAVGQFDRDVNPGGLPAPAMVKSRSGRFKYSTAIATPSFLAMTLRGMGADSEMINGLGPQRLLAFYASLVPAGRGGFLRMGGTYLPWFRWTASDKRDLFEAEAELRDLVRSAGAVRVWPETGRSPVTTVHVGASLPVGTTSVLDAAGRLRAHPRIRVSDASVLPTMPWVNPQGALCVVAELLARRSQA